MNDFERQLAENLERDIREFNADLKYEMLRQLYKEHYAQIVLFIKKSNPRSAIEDISLIDPRLTQSVMENFQLLKEINTAIAQGVLPLIRIV